MTGKVKSYVIDFTTFENLMIITSIMRIFGTYALLEGKDAETKYTKSCTLSSNVCSIKILWEGLWHFKFRKF